MKNQSEGRSVSQVRNPHPGDILKEEFLNEIGMSQNQLAHAIGVPPNRIHAIVNGTRGITADTDIRLSRFFRLSDGYWLRLQSAFDLMEARRKMGSAIRKIEPLSGARVRS
ncbi:MAG: HigA family addiction module antitoxin [Pseudomonadota bacterium]|nr:HigA family addiction module antitoxin [Pseudomonadota bacterium]